MLKNCLIYAFTVIAVLILFSCNKEKSFPEEELRIDEPTDSIDYSMIPQSDIYEVSITRGDEKDKLLVFKSSCPEYQLGYKNMLEVDQYPLGIFAGRSINWTNFSFSGSITVEVKVLDQTKVPVAGSVKIFPSRYGVTPVIDGNIIRFTLNNPGQFSVEIGDNGYKNGLMIFADPTETDIPDKSSENYKIFAHNSSDNLSSISSSNSGVYFEKGVHDIGVYKVPNNIKNIYFEEGAWVYGALIMDGNPDVKIFGRGVLSAAKLNYRESHSIEAIHQSNNIQIEGIVVADFKHFAVRLIGENNSVKWTKVIGGWVYNCDGIAAFAGSNVSNCFIWANDDAIKVYRDNITWSDCVVWQLNNGGVIQMGWMGPNSSNVTISRIDVLRAEWNKPGFNRALLNYVGNSYSEPGKSGYHSNWLIEDVVTETPIPVVFNITPDDFSTNPIHGLTLKNWDVKMIMDTEYQNMIVGNDPDEYFDGFVFDNLIFNETKLDETNWLDITGLNIERLVTPEFK
jgi:hypothetical protein